MVFYREPTKKAPCRRACPAGVDIPRYIRLISQGKFDAALAVIREKMPFPRVCGRVCWHPCEQACQKTHVGEAVSINPLKRFVAEQASTSRHSHSTNSSDKRVAVVGSGPAGLTAAYYLTTLGHRATVLEALPKVGGMMRVGIPGYRLSREALDKDIEEIKSVGVEIKTSTTVESLDSLLGHGYDAVFLALGTHYGKKLMVEGKDSPGVVDGVTFLRDASSGKSLHLGGKVAVIGSGHVAVDSARTALRFGSKEVHIICLRSEFDRRVSQEEIEEAIKEGVKIIFSVLPERISRESETLVLKCIHTEPGKHDINDPQQLIPAEGNEFSMEFDSIVTAIGETPDISSQFNLELTEANTIKVNSSTLATSVSGVFAGGDVVTGPASVIEAVAAGRKAAISIDKYLGGSGEIEEPWEPSDEELTPIVSGCFLGERPAIPTLPLKERLSGFREVELGFNKEMAMHESNRCLRCDLPILADPVKCVGCFTCGLICSINFKGTANPDNAKIKIIPPDVSIKRGESEISFRDDCDGCGMCVTFCTYGALTR